MRRIPLSISVLFACCLAPAAVTLADTSQLHFFRSQRSRAEQDLRRLARGRSLLVSWSVLRAKPTAIGGLDEATEGSSPVDRSRRFLARHPDLFPGAAAEQLQLLDVQTAGGSRFVRFQQIHHGVPVEAAQVVVSLDQQWHVRAISSEAAPLELDSVLPAIDAASALRAAGTMVQLPADVARAGSARLVILPQGGGQLVYRVVLPYPADPTGRAHLIDARTGAYLGSRRAAIIEGLPAARDEVRR